MTYHTFKSDDDKFGSFETFYHIQGQEIEPIENDDDDSETKLATGWYWWACFPGCLPDGEPMGPFKTEQEAINNANDC